MKKKIKLLTYGYLITVFIWILSGIFTISSIFLSNIGWGINLFIGSIFLIFGIWIYKREKLLCKCFNNLPLEKEKICLKFICHEVILIGLIGLFGALVLSGITFRTFHERLTVFG